jgi:hypothetical protein
MVTGCNDGTPGDQQVWLTRMQASQRLTIGTFIQALIMAAVTKWALIPVPQGQTSGGLYEAAWRYTRIRTWFASLHTVLRLTGTDAPDAAHRAYLDGLQQYLDNKFRPQIVDRAEIMANKFNKYLIPLIAPKASAQTIAHTAPSDAIAAHRSSSDRDLGPVEPDFVRDWLNELKEIFGDALHMRRKMEYYGGIFRWDFPQPGSRFKGTSVKDALAGGHDTKDKNAASRIVFITLAPGVMVSHQKIYGGAYEPEELACPASVVLYARKTKTKKKPMEPLIVDDTESEVGTAQ